MGINQCSPITTPCTSSQLLETTNYHSVSMDLPILESSSK